MNKGKQKIINRQIKIYEQKHTQKKNKNEPKEANKNRQAN